MSPLSANTVASGVDSREIRKVNRVSLRLSRQSKMTARSKRLVLLRAVRAVANVSRRLAMRRPVMIHDQARAPLPGHVQPYPLHEDTDPETRLAQEFEVHGRPCEPGEKTAEAQPAGLQDGETFADDRHRALVEIAERGQRGFAADAPVNDLARI